MKKPVFKIKDFTNLNKIKRQINDTLTGEKSQELKDALNALITELDSSEIEVDEKAFAEKVADTIKSYLSDPEADVPAAVANAIAQKMKAVKDSVSTESNGKLSQKIQNQVIKTLLNARSTDRDAVRNSVQAILVENGVSGLTFEQTIDYTIATKWEDLNPLLAKLKRTFISKFFYTTDSINAVSLIAKRWDKASAAGIEKKLQEIATLNKSISTDYAYVRQMVNQADLDDIGEAGQESTFLAWISNELDLQLANTLVRAILIGDNVNIAGERVTTFETIGTKAATDAFTIVQNPAVALTVDVSDIRTMCDKIFNPNGEPKVLIISQALLTSLSAYTYAAGGDVHYRSTEEMAGQFGVSEIYITDFLTQVAGLHAICMIPSGYWYKEKKSINVSWQEYKENRLYYMKEKNVGGAIHDLLSTAVLKEA